MSGPLDIENATTEELAREADRLDMRRRLILALMKERRRMDRERQKEASLKCKMARDLAEVGGGAS